MARMRRELCFSAGSFTYAGLYQMWGRVPVERPFRFFEECRYEYRHGRRGAYSTGNFQHVGLGEGPVGGPEPEVSPGSQVGVRAMQAVTNPGTAGGAHAYRLLPVLAVWAMRVGSMAAPVANLPSGGATEVSTRRAMTEAGISSASLMNVKAPSAGRSE